MSNVESLPVYSYDQVARASLSYFFGDQMVSDNFVDKYALRDGPTYHEKTPHDMHDRLAREFHRIECKYPNPMSYADIREALDNFGKIIPQGSPMYGIGNHVDIVSLSNCVVVDSPSDTLSSIVGHTGNELANLFKRRCGVGVDISTLRPEGAKVHNSAKTSPGAWSWADYYSYLTNKVGQNGRRGALMISFWVSHPDIRKFITMKGERNEHGEKTLVNFANVSIQISDDFMLAVENDTDWPLVFEGVEFERVRAVDLWELICKSATENAEPGLIFADNYHRNMPLSQYPSYRMICVNPCGEIGLSPYDSCRLLILNFLGFLVNAYRSDAEFLWDLFAKYVRIAMRLMDDLIDLELECLERIIAHADTEDERMLFQKLYDAAYNGRRTGLGTTGIADCLTALNLRYDDPGEARETIRRMFKTLRDEAYRESVNLAKERGAFPIFDWEIEKDCEFFKRDFPLDIIEDMKVYGRRNGSILTQAPTGTASQVAASALGQRRNVSSGCEPVFEFEMVRSKKLTTDAEQYLSVDKIDAMGNKWHKYKVYSSSAADYYEANGLPEGSPLPDWFVTSSDIDWVERVRIQGVMQSYIDHGISSTINLPKGTPKETVMTLYREAHKAGLKGITVYVDGSRDDAVLERVTVAWNERPDDLLCDIHHKQVTVSGMKVPYTIFVGLKEGRPFEVFGGLSYELKEVTESLEVGIIRRTRLTARNRYDILAPDETKIADLSMAFRSGDHAIINRLVTAGLRGTLKIEVLVDQLLKNETGEMTTYNKVLARVLKRYIEDGVKSGNRCPACESKELRYEEGCYKCNSCGYSGCN